MTPAISGAAAHRGSLPDLCGRPDVPGLLPLGAGNVRGSVRRRRIRNARRTFALGGAAVRLSHRAGPGLKARARSCQNGLGTLEPLAIYAESDCISVTSGKLV